MPFIDVDQENSNNIRLYFEDHGSGEPIVLIHGWPLSSISWEKQFTYLRDVGYRVITYDRRGFGMSGRTTQGYHYDTLAKDLDALVTKLNLDDVTLVGFSMGGGEVARYLGKYGTEHVKKAVFISSVTPFLLKTTENPEGVDKKVFDQIQSSIRADRPAFLSSFFRDFYNVDKLKGKLVSDEIVQLSWNIASTASPVGTVDCVSAWQEDFREDLEKIDIPVLVVHGNADRIVPFNSSGKRMSEFVKDCKFVEVDGAPHGLNWTHGERLNQELFDFLGGPEVQEGRGVRSAAAQPFEERSGAV